MNPAIMKIVSSCKTNCGSLALQSVNTLFFALERSPVSLPFESIKNREHLLLPDCIKVGSVRPNSSWSPL